MGRRRLRHWIVLILILVTGGALIIPMMQGAQAAARTGGNAGRARPGVTAIAGVLTGVSATSGSNAWAVGARRTESGGAHLLILHWAGTSWSRVPGPHLSVAYSALSAVSATSASNAWAVGTYGTGGGHTRTLILHWNGRSWSKVASPTPESARARLSGVSATSAGNAWAVGGYDTRSGATRTLIVHWNGRSWSRVASPNPNLSFSYLSAVSAASGRSAWAVGSRCARTCPPLRTLILRWNGKGWSTVTSPNHVAAENGLRGVSAVSGTSAWAVGNYCTSAACRALILHWNGRSWSKIASPNASRSVSLLSGITATSAANAWAVGSYCPTSECSVLRTLILRWNGKSWSQVPSPDPRPGSNELSGVIATSRSSAWAVGQHESHAVPLGQVLIVRWNGTRWERS